ncbi:hypothetical protein AN415_02955 [Acinetobacter baumannii]|nr:hypothetical protein AN415_02955 [Acinetobacter baumannii]
MQNAILRFVEYRCSILSFAFKTWISQRNFALTFGFKC